MSERGTLTESQERQTDHHDGVGQEGIVEQGNRHDLHGVLPPDGDDGEDDLPQTESVSAGLGTSGPFPTLTEQDQR